jgi:hypothetical protein
MGFLDPLFVDPTEADGGYLARLLGITPDAASATTSAMPSAMPSAAPRGAGGLLGDTPLENALRGAFMGLRAGDGASGFLDRFGRGFAASRAYVDRQRPPASDRSPQSQACRADTPGVSPAAGDSVASAPEAVAPSPAAGIPFGKDALVIDATGARWRYKGAGDPALLENWAPAQ